MYSMFWVLFYHFIGIVLSIGCLASTKMHSDIVLNQVMINQSCSTSLVRNLDTKLASDR